MYLQNNGMAFPYSGMATPCSLNAMFIQIHLVPGVAEVTGAYIGLSHPITTKEFIPVMVVAAIFARQWKGHLVQFSVDNMVVVQVLNLAYSKDSHLMHLVRIIVFLAAQFDFLCMLRGKQTP